MPYIIIVTPQHAIHQHCHATECYTSSLSRYSRPYIIIVTPQNIIHHYCHAAACHTSLSRHNVLYIITVSNNTSISRPSSRHDVWDDELVSSLHHHCHVITCHASRLLCRNTPLFWSWQQTQYAGRRAGGQRTSSLSRYMTCVIIVTLHLIHHHCHALTCHTYSLSQHNVPYIIIVKP